MDIPFWAAVQAFSLSVHAPVLFTIHCASWNVYADTELTLVWKTCYILRPKKWPPIQTNANKSFDDEYLTTRKQIYCSLSSIHLNFLESSSNCVRVTLQVLAPTTVCQSSENFLTPSTLVLTSLESKVTAYKWPLWHPSLTKSVF